MKIRIVQGLLVATFALSTVSAFAAMPTSGTSVSHEGLVIQVAKKQKQKKMTPKEEADASAKSGTVPKRYRSSVPKEYQQYIPFSKQ